MPEKMRPNFSAYCRIFFLFVIISTAVQVRSQINLDSGLVGYFKMDGNASDSSTQLIHGVSTSVTDIQGIHPLNQTGYSFNGTSSKIHAGTSNRGVLDTITVSAWVKTTNISSVSQTIASKYDWTLDKGYFIRIKNGYPAIHGRNTSGSYITTINSTAFVSDGNWHHVMGVVAGNTWEIWVDGVLVDTEIAIASNPRIDNNYPTHLGVLYDGSFSFYFDGEIDEVRIYDRELLSIEIAYIANQKNNDLITNVTSCAAYPSPWSSSLWTNSGTYSFTKYGGDLADSVEIVNLTIDTLNSTVFLSGDTLSAFSNNTYTYQWMDCAVNLPIIGAQDSVFVPVQSGSYSVIVSNGACSDTSSCFAFTKSSINLTSGLVAYFMLDSNYADSSYLTLHGTGYNLTNATGIHKYSNSAMGFNGSNSRITALTNGRTITDVVTVSTWVKTAVTTGNVFLVEKYRWNQDKGFFLSINNGIPAMTARNTSNSGAHTYNASQTFSVSDGTWHHLLGVVNQNQIEIWVDGELKSTGTLSAVNPNLTTNSALALGYNGHANGNYYTGDMDQVRIYNRVLTAGEIDSLSREKYRYKTVNYSECKSLIAPSGNVTWVQSGQFTDTITSTNAADSIYTVNLNINNPDLSISQSGDTLFAVSNSSYQYQWIDCVAGLPIIGAQSSEYSPVQSGTYAVVISNSGCVDTSNCQILTRTQVNLSTGLVGYFKFDGNAADSSTQLGHGTPTSLTNTLGISCAPNTAYDFNGTSSKVVAGNGNRGITHTVNISAWVKTTKSTGYQHVLEKYNWPTDKGYALAIKFGVPYVIARNNSNSGIHTWNASQTFTVSDGQWHHLFAKVSQNNIELWVDGVLKATATQTSSNPSLVTSKNLNIGFYNQGSSAPGYFEGSMDEVRLYNRDLTGNEIQALFNAKNTHVNSSVVACNEYTSPSGNAIWRNSGIYMDTVSTSCGGDSIYTVSLNLNGPNLSVSQIGDSLYAVSDPNYSYQWIDCTRGNLPITGAQSASFVPTESGSYSVEITANGCVDTSTCCSVYIDNNSLPYTNAIFMDGVNNYLEIPNHANLHSSTNLTLEAWIKPCTVTGTNVVYSKIWCSGNQNSYFFSVQDGKLKWVWYSGGCGATNATNRYKSTTAIIQTNVWQHVAVVHSPTGVKMFLNGQEVVATLEVGSYGNLRSSTEPIRVGSYKVLSGTQSLYFSGQMDELRVWNQSISDSLILERYNSPLIGTETGLQGYYNLDNYSTGPNKVVPNNAMALGSTGDAVTKGSASFVTPFYLNDLTSFILGEDTTLCTPSSMVFDATIPSGTYTWQDGSTSSTFTTTIGGNMNISYSNTCVSTVDSINVSIAPSLAVNLGNDTVICNVTNFVLDAGNAGATYLWSDGSTGQTLTVNQAGTYGVTVSDSCHTVIDSIHISGSIPITYLSDSSCGSYISPSGNFVWNTTGVYHDTLVNVLGCDSVIEVSLAVTPIPVTTINASSCYSYSSMGGTKTWYTSGTHYDTLSSVTGCDSVLMVNLTILPYEIVNLSINSCQSYVSPSGAQTYTASGTYLDLVSHTNSCDTLYNISLTMGQNSTSSLTQVVCGNYMSPSGKTWTSTGMYQDTISNSSGCDSVITIDLTVLPPLSTSLNQTSCNSYSWVSNGFTYWNSGVYTDTLISSTGCDSVNTLNLTIHKGDTNTLVANSCDSYFWSATGITYTQTGQYSQLYSNQYGCDSLEQLDLTINTTVSSNLTLSACNQYVSPSGSYTWNTTGIYLDTLLTSAGCDSVITVNLTINHDQYVSISETSCSSYFWVSNGFTYWNSGVYMDTLISSTGCDSVNTLNLTIHTGDTNTLVATSCDSYFWSATGITYTQTGQYSQLYSNQHGCDSLEKLDLTINTPDSTVVQIQTCGSYIWAGTGLTYSSSGSYSITLINISGCDSVVTLDLVINSASDTTISLSNCGAFTWSQNGMTYNTSGVYSDTLQSALGCDSIINLDLEILVPTQEMLNEIACGWYTAPDGRVYDSTGVYTAIIPNAAGCDSTLTINLQVTKTQTDVTQIGADLFAHSDPNYQYQWIDCVTNSPIPGETDSVYSPTVNGKYAVEITHATCFETSACTEVLNVGVHKHQMGAIQLYPNPVYDQLIISLTGLKSTEIIITDAAGITVYKGATNSEQLEIDCSDFVPGLYLVYVQSEEVKIVEKVIVR